MPKYADIIELLTLHEKLLGHPKYTVLIAKINKELEESVAALTTNPAPASVPAAEEPTTEPDTTVDRRI